MSHVKFVPQSSGKVATIRIDTGETINLTDSAHGARIAATRAGHTFDKEAKAKKAEKVKPARAVKIPETVRPEKSRLSPEQIRVLYPLAKGQVFTGPDGKKDYSLADAQAKANGFPNYYQLSRVFHAMANADSPKVEVKPEVSVGIVSVPPVPQVSESTPSWDSEAANAVAKANGFARYRAVKRAVEFADTAAERAHAAAVLELCKNAARAGFIAKATKAA